MCSDAAGLTAVARLDRSSSGCSSAGAFGRAADRKSVCKADCMLTLIPGEGCIMLSTKSQPACPMLQSEQAAAGGPPPKFLSADDRQHRLCPVILTHKDAAPQLAWFVHALMPDCRSRCHTTKLACLAWAMTGLKAWAYLQNPGCAYQHQWCW